MLKRYHHIVSGIFRIVDACVLATAWLISYWLRFALPIVGVTKGFPKFESYAALSPLIVVLWMLIFSSLQVYRSHRMLRRTDEVRLLLKAHGIALLVFITLTYLFSEYKYSRGVILYFGALGGILLVSFRLILRNALRALRRKGYNLRHAILVGEGSALETLHARIQKFPELGIRVLGVVTESKQNHFKILGTYSELQSILRTFHPDQILISLPKHQYSQLDPMLASLKDETIDIQFVPDIHEYVTIGCQIEDFDGIPIVNLNSSPLALGCGVFLKRLTDFIVSGIALLILSPLFGIIALLIKITSKGPIFYHQTRMGLDGKPFDMYKFRSMPVDAEKESGAVWATESDPRKTPLGKILRATSLDELPQFWNVLKGDMSLVGPRPERPFFVDQFKGKIPSYMLRHKVKTGITGWAQVNGWRGNTSLEKRIEFDLYYIRNWSYLLDWKILFLTLWRGFIDKNAY